MRACRLPTLVDDHRLKAACLPSSRTPENGMIIDTILTAIATVFPAPDFPSRVHEVGAGRGPAPSPRAQSLWPVTSCADDAHPGTPH